MSYTYLFVKMRKPTAVQLKLIQNSIECKMKFYFFVFFKKDSNFKERETEGERKGNINV